MEFEHSILRALLRLSRRRAQADMQGLLDRVGGSTGDLRDALRRLESGGFVFRRAEADIRLTMPGFAVAVASVAGRRRSKIVPPARASRAA